MPERSHHALELGSHRRFALAWRFSCLLSLHHPRPMHCRRCKLPCRLIIGWPRTGRRVRSGNLGQTAPEGGGAISSAGACPALQSRLHARLPHPASAQQISGWVPLNRMPRMSGVEPLPLARPAGAAARARGAGMPRCRRLEAQYALPSVRQEDPGLDYHRKRPGACAWASRRSYSARNPVQNATHSVCEAKGQPQRATARAPEQRRSGASVRMEEAMAWAAGPGDGAAGLDLDGLQARAHHWLQ